MQQSQYTVSILNVNATVHAIKYVPM